MKKKKMSTKVYHRKGTGWSFARVIPEQLQKKASKNDASTVTL